MHCAISELSKFVNWKVKLGGLVEAIEFQVADKQKNRRKKCLLC